MHEKKIQNARRGKSVLLVRMVEQGERESVTTCYTGNGRHIVHAAHEDYTHTGVLWPFFSLFLMIRQQFVIDQLSKNCKGN